MKCGHYIWKSTLEPEFGVREEMRDGVLTHVPYLIEKPYEPITDETVVAVQVPLDAALCPVCSNDPALSKEES